MGELLLCYKLSQESSWLYIIHQILIQHILVFSFLLEKSIMDGLYVIFILVEHHLYFLFRNSSSLLPNGYSIYGLCLTFWTNEFLGGYSNYKFIISFSTSISCLWFTSYSSFLSSFSFFI